ncbi:Protein ovarian tumor locus [Pseudolycoriella hygida]|uniref:Protein ovarian tumor locus n=1 Tax=Pseudolycoriella hygida TaxID=35572 RepID=A0A9Q0MT28_9DIPT|nr:Protein ovarian tumor locus [Pseudolycoriella hygida]
MEERKFSTGSIEAPDPYDKYLDEIGFYRKHIARDASCIFRVISEQMYDSQIYHPYVRELCVKYMAANRSTYEKMIKTDLTFQEYLAKLSKPRTYGSLYELHALGYRFKRNVVLFEAYTLGTWFVYEQDFQDTFLVFFTPMKHFDSVYYKSYIESIAFCQSLTYEILYSHVFKLPDVIYAVERMLHDPIEGTYVSQIEVSPYDECQETLTLSDGRHFILDHPDETECILANYSFCNFHNKQFDKMMELVSLENKTERDFPATLPRRNVSCVRQLLDENIKPFSYKVAKALDAHIYRNIEFDTWKEARKNSRFEEWTQCDSLQVGIKCLVDDIEKNQKESYYGHIQEILPHNSCVVFVETLGEYRIVPFSSIKKLPNVSWLLPTSNQKNNRSEGKKKRGSKSSGKCSNKNCQITDQSLKSLQYFTKPIHIPQQYCEFVAQPQYSSSRYSKNDENNGGNSQTNNKIVPSNKKSNQGGGEKTMKADVGKNTAPKGRSATENKPAKPEMCNIEYEPPIHYGSSGNMGYIDSSGANSFPYVERLDVESATMTHAYHVHNHNHNHNLQLNSMIKNKELLRSIYPANLNARPSLYADGSDLQGVDLSTLRFFYNMGHEYLRYMHYRFPSSAVTALLHNLTQDNRPHRYSGGYHDNFHDMGELTSDFNRAISIRDPHTNLNKPNENQNTFRRYNANAVNAPKKGAKHYRGDFNKGKRQYIDNPESCSKHQQQGYNLMPSDYSEAMSMPETNARAPETETLMPAPPTQMYSYHENSGTAESAGMYGVYSYGMYPPDNYASYSVPSGMLIQEPWSVDGDLGHTYPYHNQGNVSYFYPTPMPSFQMGQAQHGTWYPPPPVMPIQSTLPLPIQTTGSTVAPTTPTYATYVPSEAETPKPFTPNES